MRRAKSRPRITLTSGGESRDQRQDRKSPPTKIEPPTPGEKNALQQLSRTIASLHHATQGGQYTQAHQLWAVADRMTDRLPKHHTIAQRRQLEQYRILLDGLHPRKTRPTRHQRAH